MASRSNVRKGKRKFMENSENCESSMTSPQKIAQSPGVSPKSSPIKSPLLDDGNVVGSQSFVAKCFYGLKSSAKKDLASPPRKLEQFKPQKEELKILRDPSLNKLLLDRITRSPVKQAVLESCPLEEFRKIYRDEIKEIELAAKLSNNRLTRSSSKIVYRRTDSDEEDMTDDDSCMSFVDEEVSFKIPNRGFDIDSASDCSSTKVNSPASLKDRYPVPDLNIPNLVKSDDQDEYVNETSSHDLEKEDYQQSPMQRKLISCTTSTSGRKFFKTKSPGDSIAAGTRSVVVGKNFNLRFVPRSHGKEPKSQKRKKSGTTMFKPRRLSLEDSIVSPASVLSNHTNIEKTTVMTPSSRRRNSLNNEDDFVEDLIVKKDPKTYFMSSQSQDKDEDMLSNSLPESDQIVVRRTESRSPTESLLSSNDGNEDKSEKGTKVKTAQSDQRLFPIFTSEKSSGISKIKGKTSPKSLSPQLKKAANDGQSQMVIDAGQKKFGATQCNVCGMLYCYADPNDEAEHNKFHNRRLEVLKFRGWKKGREVQEFPIDLAVVVMVLSDDSKFYRKKVEDVYKIMEQDLGFPGHVPFKNPYEKVFFYVSCEKKIEGCCVAENIQEGHRVIPASTGSDARPWCCYTKAEPASLGISRIWVSESSRRSGIATRLVDSVRQWFAYGRLVPKSAVAFSDPTPDGRKFAEKYFGTPSFLVYKYKF